MSAEKKPETKKRKFNKDEKSNKNKPARLRSIAIPSSIIESVKDLTEIATLANTIARVACGYRIDEIVVYTSGGGGIVDNDNNKQDEWLKTCHLAYLLQYLIIPSYLSKSLLPQSHDCQKLYRAMDRINKKKSYSKSLLPYLPPHYYSTGDKLSKIKLREGLSLGNDGSSSKVNVGMANPIIIPHISIPPNMRVTVDIKGKKLSSPKQIERDNDYNYKLFWGYTVRIASSISKVFTRPSAAPGASQDGYSFTLWVNCKDTNTMQMSSQQEKQQGQVRRMDSDIHLLTSQPQLLILFGSYSQLSQSVEADSDLSNLENGAASLFDGKLTSCPDQLNVPESVTSALAILQ